MNVDEALEKLDPSGRQQRIITIAISMISIGSASIVMSMEFIGYVPESFECVRNNTNTNRTDILKDSCYNDSASNCDRIRFQSSYTSVATEWSLVCDRVAEAKLLQSLFMLGMMTASPFIGPLADSFGRRRVTLYMLVVQAALMLGIALAPNYGTVAILRYGTGVLSTAGLSAFTLNTELVRPHLRSRVGLFGSASFSTGLMLLGGTAYLVTSWRVLAAISAAMGTVCLAIAMFVVPTSPRWLLQKGRTQEARLVLLKIGRASGSNLGPDQLKLAAPAKSARQSADNCCLLLHHRRLAVWTAILCFNWAVHTLTYYGLTSAAANMGHGRFSTFFLSGLVEVPPLFFIVYMLERGGRRYSLCGCLGATGVSCTLIWLLPRSFIDENAGRLVLSLIGKMCISTSFTVTYVLTGEIYPTSIRNTGLGISNVSARLAGVLYPYASLLNSVQADAHFLLFGVCTLTAACLDLALPETKGKTLPDTIKEMMSQDSTAPVRNEGQMYSPLFTEDVDDDVEEILEEVKLKYGDGDDSDYEIDDNKMTPIR